MTAKHGHASGGNSFTRLTASWTAFGSSSTSFRARDLCRRRRNRSTLPHSRTLSTTTTSTSSPTNKAPLFTFGSGGHLTTTATTNGSILTTSRRTNSATSFCRTGQTQNYNEARNGPDPNRNVKIASRGTTAALISLKLVQTSF